MKAVPPPVSKVRVRRVMMGVALAAGLLLVASAILEEGAASAEGPDAALKVLGVLLALLSGLYYGARAARWLWRRLLWRVRRRLAITYLFVGLTPIVLLSILGVMAWFAASAEGMSRTLTLQVDALAAQAGACAGRLAEEAAAAPPADERAFRAWIEPRLSILRAALPGARVAFWRGGLGRETTSLVSAPAGDEVANPLGADTAPPGEPLPAWLIARDAWSGLVHTPPARGRSEAPGSAAVRGLARRRTGDGAVTVLVDVPVSRALVDRIRDVTRIGVHAEFAAAEGLRVITRDSGVEVRGSTSSSEEGRGREEPESIYLNIVSSTDWQTGIADDLVLFIFDWSQAAAMSQILGGQIMGSFWALALAIVGLVFLGMELAAVLVAFLMTREVTGTVHELSLATEAVKRGDFSFRARPKAKDQLGELAEAFNEMAAHVETLLLERVERERLQREVEIAADVQARLFPRSVPRLASAELAGGCRAARGVAGDYYDYLEVAPGRVALALGDVSGKGISASLLMSNLQASLRAQADVLAGNGNGGGAGAGGMHPGAARADGRGAVARLTSIINDHLVKNTEPNRYATLFLALYDDATRLLRYTNAGHNAPILIGSDGSVGRLVPSGTIVGGFEDARYEEREIAVPPGSVLVMFSDGISEARNAVEEEYGEDRLARFAAEFRGLPAEDLRRAVFQEVDRWSEGQEQGDDQTIVILKASAGGAG